MRYRIALAFLMASLAMAANARTVKLAGDYGCGLISFQLDRLDAIKVVATELDLRSKGKSTPELKQAADKATADLVRISKENCRPVTGSYKVVETRAVPGGTALRIEPSITESLWVLE